jgi:ATP-dependent Clp protease ATP-binding subunit ClpA
MGDFVRGPFGEARALGHTWCGEEHLLLHLLAEEPFLGLTHDEARAAIIARVERDGRPVPDDWQGSGCSSAPTFHEALGRATGFALGTGVTRLNPEHIWAALLWDPAGVASTVLAAQGHDRATVLAAAAPLGLLVPALPAANPLPGPAERQAVAVRHGFSGFEHLLLALLAGEPDDRVGLLLRDAGLTHELQSARVSTMLDGMDPPCPPPADPSKAPPNPRARQVFAAAEGLAATLGDGVVRSTDALIAYLWQEDGQQLFAIEAGGSSGPALVGALTEVGVRVPAVPLPEPDREPWGEWIAVPKDRVDDVAAAVRKRHPVRRGHLTSIGTRDGVIAKAHIDLQAIVDEVLAIPRPIPLPGPAPA